MRSIVLRYLGKGNRACLYGFALFVLYLLVFGSLGHCPFQTCPHCDRKGRVFERSKLVGDPFKKASGFSAQEYIRKRVWRECVHCGQVFDQREEDVVYEEDFC